MNGSRWVVLGAFALAAVLVGCGGGGGAGAAQTGSVEFSIEWPGRAWRPPASTESVRIDLSQSGLAVGSQLAVRPAGAQTDRVVFTGVPVGSITASIVAYPNPSGNGVPVASGVVAGVVTANSAVEIPITASTTIARLSITPAVTTVMSGKQVKYTGVALDSADRVVLTKPDRWDWTTDSQQIAAITTGTTTPTLTAGGLGSTTVRVRETESGVTGSAVVTVAGPTLSGRVYTDGTTTPVPGATVVMVTVTGAELSRTTTDANGSYRFASIPATGQCLRVDPPADGYYGGIVRYGGALYDQTRSNLAKTGPCLISFGAHPSEDVTLGSIYLFADGAAPPPPVFTCPK